MKQFINLLRLKTLELELLMFLRKHKIIFSTNLKFQPIISSYDSISFKLEKISNVLDKTVLPNGKKNTLDFVT